MVIIFWFLSAVFIALKFLKPGESFLLRALYAFGAVLAFGWAWDYLLADRQLLSALIGPISLIVLVRLLKMGKAAKTLTQS